MLNNNNICSLDRLPTGQHGKVTAVSGKSSQELRRRLQDMGIIHGTLIESSFGSIFSDPKAYSVRGTVIALRNDDARGILVEMI